jgi:hypothetical protein
LAPPSPCRASTKNSLDPLRQESASTKPLHQEGALVPGENLHQALAEPPPKNSLDPLRQESASTKPLHQEGALAPGESLHPITCVRREPIPSTCIRREPTPSTCVRREPPSIPCVKREPWHQERASTKSPWHQEKASTSGGKTWHQESLHHALGVRREPPSTIRCIRREPWLQERASSLHLHQERASTNILFVRSLEVVNGKKVH